MVVPDNTHFQETIPLPTGYKKINIFKIALYVAKRRIENKFRFNAKRVRFHFELENASKYTTKTRIWNKKRIYLFY